MFPWQNTTNNLYKGWCILQSKEDTENWIGCLREKVLIWMINSVWEPIDGLVFCALCKSSLHIILMLTSMPAEIWLQVELCYYYSCGWIIFCKHSLLHLLIGLIKNWWSIASQERRGGTPGKYAGKETGKRIHQPAKEEGTGAAYSGSNGPWDRV